MNTKNQISLALYGIMLIAVFFAAFGAGSLPSVRAQDAATETPKYVVNFIASGSNQIPLDARGAIIHAMNAWQEVAPADNTFYLIDINWHDWWAIATLTSANIFAPLPEGDDTSLDLGNLISLLLIYTNNGWQAAIDVDENVRSLLLLIPDSELSPESKNVIFPPASEVRRPPDISAQQSYNNYKFPWPAGHAWRLTNGWHDSYTWRGLFPANTSLDFDIVGGEGSNSDIVAAAPGVVTYRCTTNVDDQALIYITTDGTSEKIGYLHLSKASLVSAGTHVSQGQVIGRMASMDNGSGGGTTPPSGSCAASVSMRTHVHLYLPSKPFVIDGVTFSDSSLPWGQDLYSSQTGGGGGGSCPGPSLNSPNDGYVSSGQTITFSWSALSGCTFNGYTFRVNDSSNMDDSPIIDTGEGGTSRTETIGTQWNNRDMWWGVKAANAPNGASWSVRRFRIEPGSSNCNPNSDQIALFEHGNYGGTCKIFGIGDYADPGAMGFPNDAASSIKVGSNVKAILYEHAGYGGASEEFSGDDSDFGNNTIGHDRVSSIKVQSRGCNPNSDQISLYAGTSYTGACVTLGIGVYPDPGYLGAVGNDNAESVRVGSNVEAVLCEHDNYQGTCSTLSSDEINLGNHPIGGNRVSSVKVQTRAPAGDGYEPDGDSGQANWISSGSPQNHSIVPATDTDWGKFQLDATSAITLETSGSTGSDTRMWLYDSNLNELEYSDDEGTDYYSYIDRSCGVDALAAGTYYVKVDEYGNNDEISSYNLSFNVTATCAPPTPSNFHVSATTTDSITLGWDDVSGETGYNIYKWGYDGTNWTFIYYASVGADVTTYTDTNLPCGNDFNYYELSAYNGIGESNHVGWVQGTTDACPSSELNITSLSYYPGTAYANDDIWVKVEIQNSSNVNASGFWIDVYVDHQPTACDEWGGYYIWVDGLAANSTDFWWIEVPAGDLAASTYNIYAFVDSGCQVSENDENNNIAGPTSLALLTPPPAPVHDDFDAARLISPLPYTDTVDVTGAWRAWDDPSVSTCDLAPGLASVWYKYTPSSNTRLSLDTFGSDYDTYIAVWTGSRGNLSLVGCNDDTPGSYPSALQVNLTAGTTYFIEIAEWNGSITSLAMDTSMRNRPRPGENGSSGLSVGKASSITPKPTSEVGALAGGSLQFHVLPMPALTVSKSGTGSGTVTSSPAGINCGSTCSYAFANNTIVTLTASPTSPSTFGGWSGGGCSGTGTCIVTLSSAQSVTATFNYPNQTLTVGKTGTGNGTVTSSPSGINCGSDCSETYSYNTSVTLTASVSSGSTFTGWSGAGCSGTGTCTVTMTAAASVTANFTLNTYTLFLPLILR